MLPSRAMSGQSSSMRKSRLEAQARPSYLPKPRNAGSIDRLSQDRLSYRPSNARSSSADPARSTLAGVRQSREASATKIPLNSRSRSQQGDPRYGQAPMTPLRSSHYSRPTTTPVRTPSEDRNTRSWQSSLDRALAFVTIKDQRPLTNPAWQRSECHRAQEGLASLGVSDGGGGAALIRPLTITRFVDITRALLNIITGDNKLNNDNYVTKVPHIGKLLLYPGTVSKSWLKSVNTLHAFPHALALVCYLLDMAQRIEMPVQDERLYLEKDELAVLRRDFLQKCFIRFQEPGASFEDLDEEYLLQLQQLLGNDDEKIAELQQVIKKYELCLEDEADLAARADEARRAERRAALLAELRALRAARLQARSRREAAAAGLRDARLAQAPLDAELERASAESQQLRKEVEEQSMTVAERAKLLDEVDYANRVQDSKQALADQISKMLVSKESELGLWQKTTLASCVQYKQALIHLSSRYPHLAALAIDEKELMESECAETVLKAQEALRAQVSSLGEQRAAAESRRLAAARQQAHQLEETRAQIAEIQASIAREQEILSSEEQAEAAAAAAWAREEAEGGARLEALRARAGGAAGPARALWEREAAEAQQKLSTLKKYVEDKRTEAQSSLRRARRRRAELVGEHIVKWSERLDAVGQ